MLKYGDDDVETLTPAEKKKSAKETVFEAFTIGNYVKL